jgi:hypothetical protein
MKLQNPTLITLNNTLHIKADNLEPVEVDSSCVDEFYKIINLAYFKSGGYLKHGITYKEFKKDGVKIPKRKANSIYLHMVDGINKAFLLPAKEVAQIHTQDWGIKQTYTIEEIEKAIRSLHYEDYHLDIIVTHVINNLKK